MDLKMFSLPNTLKIMAISILLSFSLAIMANAATDKHGREIKEPQKQKQKQESTNKWKTWDKRYYAANASNVDYLKKTKKTSVKPQKPADKALYNEECSACHFLYQPWLLPARSWELIMQGNEDHFGEDLSLDDESVRQILNYLEANSTENTKVKRKWARKILRNLPPTPPESIRDVPYIKRKHRKLFRKDVFKRSSINSFSNCVACHKTAPKGNYDDDHVKIPKK